MSIDSSSDQDAGERRIGPTVTKDRWVNHARQKLAKGYVLIVSASRKNANFYLPTKGYEMCAFDVAKKLIADGSIVKTRTHHLGDVYELSGPLPTITPAPRPVDDDDEDGDVGVEFIEGLDEDTAEDEEDDELDQPENELDDPNADSDDEDEIEDEDDERDF